MFSTCVVQNQAANFGSLYIGVCGSAFNHIMLNLFLSSHLCLFILFCVFTAKICSQKRTCLEGRNLEPACSLQRGPSSLSTQGSCVKVGPHAALCQGLACGPRPALHGFSGRGSAPPLTPFNIYVWALHTCSPTLESGASRGFREKRVWCGRLHSQWL